MMYEIVRYTLFIAFLFGLWYIAQPFTFLRWFLSLICVVGLGIVMYEWGYSDALDELKRAKR